MTLVTSTGLLNIEPG